MSWLALTVEVDAASAEALSDALLEAGAVSVTIDEPHAVSNHLTALIASDHDAGVVLAQAAQRAGLDATPQMRLIRVPDEDWVLRSQAQFQPLTIGRALWVGASWHSHPPGIAAVVRIDPGLAFGTGSHPTTQLALRFLERRIGGGERVLDYGSGSGILAIAAAKLGAGSVDAVDLDAQALEATAANARANRVAVNALAPEALPPAGYDIVVSNILLKPLIVLAPLLASRVAAGGEIALSGILAAQVGELAAAYERWFELGAADLLDDWALLCGVRK
jgi:ribosomal protein L11 methyltransferase